MASPIPVGPARPPDVSLVVSFYNQEHLAALFLDSICCQKCVCTFELLVCDDGSSDELFQLVRSFARRTQLDLRYIWQPATPEVTGRASIWRICQCLGPRYFPAAREERYPFGHAWARHLYSRQRDARSADRSRPFRHHLPNPPGSPLYLRATRAGGGDTEFAAANPAYGAILNYYLPGQTDDVRIEVLNAAGKVLRSIPRLQMSALRECIALHGSARYRIARRRWWTARRW